MVMLDDNSKKVLLISLGVILMLFSTIGMQVVEDDSVLVTAKTINNETTGGWTSSNISMNGSRWTGDGLLASNLKNDSQLNMSGLVAYWSMDESSGTIAHQVNTESGLINTTNQGTLVNMNTGLNNCTGNCSGWNSSGKIGNGLSFDGVNDYANILNSDSLNLSSVITVGFWIRTLSMNDIGVLTKFAGGGQTSSSWAFLGYLDGISFIVVETDLGTSTTARISISDGVWHHIVGVANGSKLKIYRDGIFQADVGYDGTIQVSTTSLKIGARSKIADGTAEYFFNGSLDEISIYNRALNSSEVAVLYNTSMRNISMPLILNQTASTNNVIDKVKMNYLYGDNYHNASLYSKQNGTTIWSLITANALNNTWYSIANRYHAMDFGVQLNGNGSNTTFLQSLQWDEGTGNRPVCVASDGKLVIC